MDRKDLIEIARQLLTEMDKEDVIEDIASCLDEADYELTHSNYIREARAIVQEVLDEQKINENL